MFANEDFVDMRKKMVIHQLQERGITDSRVIDAVSRIPREQFVLTQDQRLAYDDSPLPIGFGQTISQPYMTAYMVEQLEIKATDSVLEIGTGSAYMAAVLGELAKEVHTLEIVPELYQRSAKLMKALHYSHVICYLRNGYEGLPSRAPFEKIVLTAAPESVPDTLLEQLAVGGRLIAPVGSIRMFQKLIQIDKIDRNRINETELMGVSFVEMIHD